MSILEEIGPLGPLFVLLFVGLALALDAWPRPTARALTPLWRRVLVTARHRRAAPCSVWVLFGRREAIEALKAKLGGLDLGAVHEFSGPPRPGIWRAPADLDQLRLICRSSGMTMAELAARVDGSPIFRDLP